MCSKQEGVSLTWVDVISRPRIERTAITFATDVTDRGVSPDPRSPLLVVTLVVRSHLVALGLMFGFA